MKKRDAAREKPEDSGLFGYSVDLASGPRLKGKIVDLGTEGLMIETHESLLVRENFIAEFMLPGTLTSIQVAGEIAWVRLCQETGDEDVCRYRAGIRFVDLKEPFLSLIRDYTLKLLCDEEQVRKQGIDQVLKDIANLPEKESRAAHNILTRKGLISKS